MQNNNNQNKADLSADAKPFIPGGAPPSGAGPSGGGAPSGGGGGGGNMGGNIGGGGTAPFMPAGGGGGGAQPRVPGGGPPPNSSGGGGGGNFGNNPRSPIHPHSGGGGGGPGMGGGGGGDMPNLGAPANVPMFNRGNQNMHGGGGGGNFGNNMGPNSHHGGNMGHGPGPNMGGGNNRFGSGPQGGGGFNHHQQGGPQGHHGGGGGPNMNHHGGGGPNHHNGPGGGWNGGGNPNHHGPNQNHMQHRVPGGGGNFGPGPGQGNMGPGHHGGHPSGPQHHGGPQGGHHLGGNMGMHGPGGHGPPEQPPRPLVVLMLGGICSGKSAVAQKICEMEKGFMYIQNDEDMAGYTKLDGLLRQPNPNSRTRGYILDDFIIRCKEEIHYIVHLLSKCRLAIDNVIYLQTDDMDGCLERAGLEAGPEPGKMAQHAAHYEATMDYFNHIPNLVSAPSDIMNKSLEKLAQELLVTLGASIPGQKEKIHPLPTKLMNFASFLPDFSQFLQVKKQVTEQLGGKWNNFLTQAGGSLDYPKFVRKNHNLRKYRVSANFQGERVMVVKRGKEVYLIPENHYGMFQLDTHLVPTQFAIMDDFIFDAIAVKLRGGNPQEENRIIFVNDLLFLDNDASMEPTPLSRSYFERSTKIKEKLHGLPANTIFMQRPTFHINEIGTQLVNKEWKFPGDGLIFYPPGRYAAGQDPRVLTFDFPHDALVTMRVWDGAAATMDPPTNPPQPGAKRVPPPETGWSFTGLVIDYKGEEVILDDKVQVVSDMAEKFNINDGCLLDFKRMAPQKKLGVIIPPHWKFVQRADHKAKPSLMESAQYIVDPDWTKDQLTSACCSMKPQGEFVQSAPAGPMSPI